MAEINTIKVNGEDHNIGLKLKLAATGTVNPTKNYSMTLDNTLEKGKWYLLDFVSQVSYNRQQLIFKLGEYISDGEAVIGNIVHTNDDDAPTTYLLRAKTTSIRCEVYPPDRETNEYHDFYYFEDDTESSDKMYIYELPLSL